MIKISIPKPNQPCNVRSSDGQIYGKASTYEEFRTIVSGVSPAHVSFAVSDHSWVAIDPESDQLLFRAKFDDNN